MPNSNSRFICLAMFAASFLLGCWCASAQGQLPTLKSETRDGYIDVEVLEKQVRRNTEAIEKVREDVASLQVLTANTKTPGSSKLNSSELQISELPPISEARIYIPPTITSSPTPIYSPVIWNTEVMDSFPVFSRASTATVPVITRVDTWSFSQPESSLFNSNAARPIKRGLPRCRIINGRRSCN